MKDVDACRGWTSEVNRLHRRASHGDGGGRGWITCCLSLSVDSVREGHSVADYCLRPIEKKHCLNTRERKNTR